MVRFRNMNMNEVTAHLAASLCLPQSELSRVLDTPPELMEFSMNEWNNCLIGQLLTDELPDEVHKMRWAFKSKWNLRYNLHIFHVGGCRFVFRFKYERDLRRVLKEEPYQIYGQLIILDRWNPAIPPAMVDLYTTPIWLVVLNHLPMHFGREWVKYLVQGVGEVLQMIPANGIPYGEGAVSVKVAINPYLVLPQGINVRDAGNNYHWVSFFYPFLPFQFCKRCYCFGHREDDCPMFRNENGYSVDEHQEEFDTEDSNSWEDEASLNEYIHDENEISIMSAELQQIIDQPHEFILSEDENIQVQQQQQIQQESGTTELELFGENANLSLSLVTFTNELELDLERLGRGLKRPRLSLGLHHEMGPDWNESDSNGLCQHEDDGPDLSVTGQIYLGLTLGQSASESNSNELEFNSIAPFADPEALSEHVEIINSYLSDLEIVDENVQMHQFLTSNHVEEEFLSGNLVDTPTYSDALEDVDLEVNLDYDLEVSYEDFPHERFDRETSLLSIMDSTGNNYSNSSPAIPHALISSTDLTTWNHPLNLQEEDFVELNLD